MYGQFSKRNTSHNPGSQILEQALSGLPTKWKNYIIRFVFTLLILFCLGQELPHIYVYIMLQRFVFTWLMIGGFCLIIYGGPLALMITVFCVQVKVVSII